MDVIIFGETSVGKGVGSWTIYDSKYKYALQPITMRYYNSLDETTPDEGITPDYYIPDGYSTSKKEIGNTDELLLSTAINIILGQPNKIKSALDNKPFIDYKHVLTPIGEPSFVSEFKFKTHFN